MENENVKLFLQYLEDSNTVCFFGGAGVSTESGIPDFRSKDGLYNQHDVRFDQYSPEYLLSHSCIMNEPQVYFEFHRQKMDTRNVKPNKAHDFLAKLEKSGKLAGIITQNIDGLHQKAGSEKVYEIHGSALRNYCTRCGKKFDVNYVFDSEESIPYCECGGMIRPDITLYEEGLPEEAVNGAVALLSRADMLIIGGTSLTVYPAASFINYFRGKYLVIINESELPIQKKEHTLIVREKIGAFFKKVEESQEKDK